MSETRARAREMLPTVLLTLLSIVQAVALEALGSRLVEIASLFVGDVRSWVFGLQAAAIFQGIVLVWIFYTSILMRFRWVPTVRDSVLPFVLGALELALVELIGTRFVAPWLGVFGVIFALAIWTSRGMFRTAQGDAYNREVTAEMAGETIAERIATYVFVLSFFAFGAAVYWTEPFGRTAVVAVVFTNIACFVQTWMIRGYWNNSIGSPEVPEPGEPAEAPDQAE